MKGILQLSVVVLGDEWQSNRFASLIAFLRSESHFMTFDCVLQIRMRFVVV